MSLEHKTAVEGKKADVAKHCPPMVEDSDVLSPKKQRYTLNEDIDTDETAKPLMQAVFGEPIFVYFNRLRDNLDTSLYAKRDNTLEDGLYLHKRIIRMNGGATAIPSAGSVLHHVVLYWRRADGKLESFDFGPADGADVTSNVMEEVAAKRIHCEEASVPEEDTAAFLYLGRPALDPSSALAKKALAFAQARRYHAIRNNCIHFADFFVRVLSGGAVRSAPLLYDAVAGVVLPQDPPILVMLQMLFRTSWFDLCDGSAMYKAFTASRALPQKTAAAAPTVTTSAAAAAAIPIALDAILAAAAGKSAAVSTPVSCLAMAMLDALSSAAASAQQQQSSQSAPAAVSTVGHPSSSSTDDAA